MQTGDSDKKAEARRAAVNSTIQGSAADIIKMAMVAIERTLIAREIKARLVLEMHDELIYEVRNKHLDELAQIVSDCMANATASLAEPFSVILPVNMKKGANWGELSDFKPSN